MEQREKKLLEQHSVGSRGGRVEAVFDVFFTRCIISDLPTAETD